MNRKLFSKKISVFGILVLFMVVTIGPGIGAQFTKTINKKMIGQNVESNDGSEMVQIVVRQYNEGGKNIQTIHKISVDEIKSLNDRLQNICYDEKPLREILEEQITILKEGNLISEDMTLDCILGDKIDISNDINIPVYFTDNPPLIGGHCIVAFFGLGIGGALGGHSIHQGPGMDLAVVAAGYFPFIIYKGIHTQIARGAYGVFYAGGILGYLGLLIFSIWPEPKIYSPFIFGIGYTPLTAWIPIPILETNARTTINGV